jgi:beta-lactamase class D OXA-58
MSRAKTSTIPQVNNSIIDQNVQALFNEISADAVFVTYDGQNIKNSAVILADELVATI